MRTWLVRKDTGKPKERIRVANVYRIHPRVGALKIEAHLLFPHCSRVARVEQSADLCVGKATRDSLAPAGEVGQRGEPTIAGAGPDIHDGPLVWPREGLREDGALHTRSVESGEGSLARLDASFGVMA